jgi:phenylpropionate dioxygenase-like ring-hydroxylating dioxygenase large terminal subunit
MVMMLDLIAKSVGEALDNGTMLPQDAYTSLEWFEAERNAVHDRTWAYVCHASQLPPGGFRRVRVGAEDLVVTRDRDGKVHALFNVCRHRAAEVVTEECGTARRLVCPYHSWSYDLSGKLMVAPGMQKDIARDDLSLLAARVHEWHGFIFVLVGDSLPAATSFEPSVTDTTRLEMLRLDEAKVIHVERYDIAANWKLVRENFVECYHCSANHPELLAAFDLRNQYDEEGRQTDAFVPIKEGMCSLSLDGQPVCARPFGDFGEIPTSDWAYTIGQLLPKFVVFGNPDHAISFSFQPVAVDHTVVTCEWLVHRDAVEGVDYDTKNVIVVLHQTNLQDIPLCESAQRGVESRAYRPGPLSEYREPDIVDFHRMYAGWIRSAMS